MIAEIRKITTEQWFLILALGLSLLLSFLLGYVSFRYAKLDICKSPMEVGSFSEKIEVKLGPKNHAADGKLVR
jgi:hypothetical protein